MVWKGGKTYFFGSLRPIMKFELFLDSVGVLPSKATNRCGYMLKLNFYAHWKDSLWLSYFVTKIANLIYLACKCKKQVASHLVSTSILVRIVLISKLRG